MITNLTPEALDSTSTTKRCEVCRGSGTLRDKQCPHCARGRSHKPGVSCGAPCPSCSPPPPPRPDERNASIEWEDIFDDQWFKLKEVSKTLNQHRWHVKQLVRSLLLSYG